MLTASSNGTQAPLLQLYVPSPAAPAARLTPVLQQLLPKLRTVTASAAPRWTQQLALGILGRIALAIAAVSDLLGPLGLPGRRLQPHALDVVLSYAPGLPPYAHSGCSPVHPGYSPVHQVFDLPGRAISPADKPALREDIEALIAFFVRTFVMEELLVRKSVMFLFMLAD